jgi:hypothetical protein
LIDIGAHLFFIKPGGRGFLLAPPRREAAVNPTDWKSL